MDYGFLAAATAGFGGWFAGSNAIITAVGLGAIGLFLMLPRDNATVAKFGALVGVVALVHLGMALVDGARDFGGVPLFFYIFAFIMIAGSVGVICHPKPVYAALYFVLVTLAGAGLFVMLMAEFMAVVLIIVYAGAILVTYLFVLMLASQGKKATPAYDRVASEPLIAVLVSFVLLGTILKVMYRDDVANAVPVAQLTPAHANPQVKTAIADMDENFVAKPGEVVPGNMQLLGLNLYGDYALSLELAGVLLTIALVGAIVIARKNVELEQTAGTGQLPFE